MADETKEILAPEFASLPLENIIGGAIKAVVNGQAISSQTTLNFINGIKDSTVEFSTSVSSDNKDDKMVIKVPTLAVVPVPSLRIDSFTVHFNYEIKSIQSTTKATSEDVTLTGGLSKFLSGIASLDLKGGISHKSTSESSLNRSGMLDITLHASQAEIPEGLARVLSLMAKVVPDAPKK